MKRIGILSDTHGYWDDRYLEYFAECDEIWHAGDIGSFELIRRLEEFRPVKAVCGNCDGGDTRKTYPQILEWECENTRVMMTHIGGYPGKYAPGIRKILAEKRPQLFIAGHSHILKVMFDRQDESALHQSRSRRNHGLAQGAHPHPGHFITGQLQQSGSH